MEVDSDFIQADPKKAWDGLKKLIELFNYTINFSSSNLLKDPEGCTNYGM